jgi:hypothetical protein
MMAIALGLHVRCGIEDNIWNQRQTAKITTVEQIGQLVRIAREFGREVANGKEARQIYKVGTFYESTDETLARNGFAPNREPRQAEFAGTLEPGRGRAMSGSPGRPSARAAH